MTPKLRSLASAVSCFIASLGFVLFPSQADAQKHLYEVKRTLSEPTFELLYGRGTNAYAVYSKTRKEWSTYKFPVHLKVGLWTSGGFGSIATETINGFEYKNGPINQLVAIDTKGQFCCFDLKKPLNGLLRPSIKGATMLYYIADGKIYAFSGVTGTWDTLAAPHIPEVVWLDAMGNTHDPKSLLQHGFDAVSTDGLVVTLKQGVARFLPERGYWEIEASPAADALESADGETAEEPKGE